MEIDRGNEKRWKGKTERIYKEDRKKNMYTLRTGRRRGVGRRREM